MHGIIQPPTLAQQRAVVTHQPPCGYRGTRNLRAVQMLLGHASIATTERYTAVDDDEIRAAMAAAVGDW